MQFSHFHHVCIRYLRAVRWSHLDLGEGCRLEDIYIYIYIFMIYKLLLFLSLILFLLTLQYTVWPGWGATYTSGVE